MLTNNSPRNAARAMAVVCAFAGMDCSLAAPDFANWRPVAHASRIEAAEAPKIDGDISDPVWSKAAAFDEFYQTEPSWGAAPGERTVVRVLYDANNIYFAIMAYDRDPSQITARLKQRDAALYNDDSVRIYLDPNMTRRDAYSFQFNALGAKRDGLVQNNLTTLFEWNAIWTVKTAVLPDGWSAEVAIPFRSISYNHRSDWGFEMDRMIARRNTGMRWSSIHKGVTSNNVSLAGTLDGIEGIESGLGLDVQAFALARYRKNWDSGEGTGVSFRPSGNIFYKVTPSLTGTLTYNTDFSDAPLDQRQVNISRYSLFYPERRDFFLQDVASFEFGGRTLNSGDDPNAAPFFSRRIGIVRDTPVNILGGVKLSGDYDGYGVGALTVRTARGGGAGSETLSVLRLTAPLLDESKLGVVMTNGDPTGLSDNTVTGADFQFRNSRLLGDKIIRADAFVERSFSTTRGKDSAFGLTIDLPNEPWNNYFMFKQVGDNFAPALGFVSRPGVRTYQDATKYRTRYDDGGWLRWIELSAWAWIETDLKDRPNSRIAGAYLSAYTETGEFFQIEGKIDNEVVRTPFKLPHDISVAADNYTFGVFHTHFESFPGRLISTVFDLEYSGFYGGALLRTDTTLNLNPTDSVSLGVRHLMQQISVPAGDVDVHVGSVDASFNFTPDMQLRGQLQYDNITKALQLSLRYRWELEPGSELLIVAGDDATLRETYYQSHTSQFSIRLGKTFRF